ncbi:MAG: diacylglycerol/lipid kinase family protein [Bacteroidota bacterium]
MMEESAKPEKILFIINPVSGTKDKASIETLIKKKSGKSYEPKIRYTQYAGHGSKLARKNFKKGIKKFVAVGGDGTVNEIASQLIDTDAVIGIIPIGSGNGLARHLNIPLKAGPALELICNHKLVKIDYGTMNDKVFFCTCGVGFDARVGSKFAESDGRGFITYARTTIKEYFSYKTRKYTIKTGKKKNKLKTRAFLITFANASQYGNNAYIAPDADIQDGKMDICMMLPFPKGRVFDLGLRLFRKTMGRSKYTNMLRTREAILERKKPGEVHFDGEPGWMKKNIKVKMHKQGLNVMVAVNSKLS